MSKNCLESISVEILNEDTARVVFERTRGRSEYVVRKDSYASRQLPSILNKSKHSTYSSQKKKGGGIKWTNDLYQEDIPAKHTYEYW